MSITKKERRHCLLEHLLVCRAFRGCVFYMRDPGAIDSSYTSTPGGAFFLRSQTLLLVMGHIHQGSRFNQTISMWVSHNKRNSHIISRRADAAGNPVVNIVVNYRVNVGTLGWDYCTYRTDAEREELSLRAVGLSMEMVGLAHCMGLVLSMGEEGTTRRMGGRKMDSDNALQHHRSLIILLDYSSWLLGPYVIEMQSQMGNEGIDTLCQKSLFDEWLFKI